MMRVLFIDDDANVLDGLRRALRSARGVWDMQFVTSARQALEACVSGIKELAALDPAQTRERDVLAESVRQAVARAAAAKRAA